MRLPSFSNRGRSNFDELDKEIAEAGLPIGTGFGPVKQTPYGWFPQPPNAVGSVTVGYKSQYWLVSNKPTKTE